MEMLAHINKRVKSRSSVKLPMEKLVEQYTSADTTEFVTVSCHPPSFAAQSPQLSSSYLWRYVSELHYFVFENGFQTNSELGETSSYGQTLFGFLTKASHSPSEVYRWITFDIWSSFLLISNVFSILQMVLPCFDSLTLPSKLEERKAMFGLEKNSDLQPTLLDFMMDALLLPYKSVTSTC